MKSLTFSFDDGVTQDERLLRILNRYGLKATFNLNSQLLGQDGSLVCDGVRVRHRKVRADEVADLYRGHEVAAHTLTHPNLTTLPEKEVIRQVAEDQARLAELTGSPIVGMAYPMGGVNVNDDVARIIRENTSIRYARTIVSSYNFQVGGDLLRYHPTVYHREWDRMLALTERFIALETDEPQVLCIWGHSYEYDIADTWGAMEAFCARISWREGIRYCTNREALLP